MKEVFEKIIEQFISIRRVVKNDEDLEWNRAVYKCTEIVRQAAGCNNGWIPCSEKMPPVETEVFILARRKFKDGSYSYTTTMAMYEDGTVSECDSCWMWEDIDGEYDEENDCYILPEGWWESRKYNTMDAHNFEVDDEVIAWQPLPEVPEQYQPKRE